MMEFAVAHTGIPANRMAIIGDQLASDMQMAQEFGMVSVLVLSGQTTRDDLVNATYQPDYVVESISHLTPLFQ
jgi:ribonucleotide monophosphatase NagD (HAD superfamily)